MNEKLTTKYWEERGRKAAIEVVAFHKAACQESFDNRDKSGELCHARMSGARQLGEIFLKAAKEIYLEP